MLTGLIGKTNTIHELFWNYFELSLEHSRTFYEPQREYFELVTKLKIILDCYVMILRFLLCITPYRLDFRSS